MLSKSEIFELAKKISELDDEKKIYLKGFIEGKKRGEN